MRKILLLTLTTALIVLLVVTTRVGLEASWQQNVASRDLAAQLVGAGSDCTYQSAPGMVERLERAIELRPVSTGAWRNLIRIKGLTNRSWIADSLNATSGHWPPEEALSVFYPGRMPPVQIWEPERCLETWGAWTAALIEAVSGRWPESVALYQAGMAMAPGRVPAEIMQEYYLALARYLLEATPESASQQLSAAKYLALGGASQDAGALFAAVQDDPSLSPAQRCQAAQGLAWLQAGEGVSHSLPTWPVSQEGDPCDPQSPDVSPGWTVNQGPPVIDPGSGAELTGFDLDQDVLDAGGEVMGVLHWRTPEGAMVKQSFRQPNLWVNSGTSWLAWPGVAPCIPGYIEPAWVTPCAGEVAATTDDPATRNPVATLFNAPGDHPDSYVSTASLPLNAGRWVVYGGRWRSEGQFPRGHVSRESSDGKYEIVLGLSDLPPGAWHPVVAAAMPLAEGDEYSAWIRPRVGVGEGTLWFDDVFSFELPVYHEQP
jgi:hypothetical protein